ELADCQLVPAEGRCFERSVLFCSDGGSARIERCEPGTQCGFDLARESFRCIPPSEDACEGVGDLGVCDGDDQLRCENGQVVRAPCGACGVRCRVSVRDGSAICNP